jgi:hypothetical protein
MRARLVVALTVWSLAALPTLSAVAEKDKKDAGAKLAARAEEVRGTFKTFCDGWVQKLRERERHNISKIKWQPSANGVVGEYVGYDTDHFRVLDIINIDTVPIGKVMYMELKLRLSGPSEVEALAQKPQIVEQTEVTELFRFERGAWVY